MIRIGTQAFAVGIAAGLILAAGICLGLAAAERWSR